MKSLFSPLCSALLALACAVPALAQSYTWKQVKIGPGGVISGFAIANDGTTYARGDTEGVFKWDGSKWNNLMYWISEGDYPSPGADAIAVVPGNANTVFITASGGAANGRGVFKSTNGGGNWSLVLSESSVNSNSAHRTTGERLAVDPRNSAVVYLATITGKIYRSLSNGDHGTWSQLGSTGLPSGVVVRSLVIDGTATVGSGSTLRSSKVYLGTASSGVYLSGNGGDSYSALANSPSAVNYMAPTGSGALLVGHTAGVSRYSGGSWSDKTPAGYANKSFTLATNPANRAQVVVAWRNGSGAKLWRSTNSGDSWAGPFSKGDGNVTVSNDVPWVKRELGQYANGMAFNPAVNGQLLMGDSYNAWITENAFASPMAWTNRAANLELTAVKVMACPPSGPMLFTGTQDNLGFRHTNLTAYPTIPGGISNSSSDYVSEMTGIDFSQLQPAQMAFAMSHGDYTPRIYTSSDGGQNVTLKSLPPGFTKDSYVGGARIAMAANDPQKLVYLPNSSKPYYSTNGGSSWTAASVSDNATFRVGAFYDHQFPLAADRVNSSYFYLTRRDTSAWKTALYVSSDSGASWTRKLDFADNGGQQFLAAAPGKTGHIAYAAQNAGVFVSTNAHTSSPSIASVGNFASALSVAWGKAGASGQPTLFAYGKRNNDIWGLYRSTDLGQNWIRISGNPNTVAVGWTIAADQQTFGRVYVAFGGGVLYGDGGESPGTATIKVETYDPATAKSSAVHRLVSETGASAGSFTLLEAIGSGDYVTYAVPNVQARSYAVYVGVRKHPERGKFQLGVAPIVNGTYTSHGSEQDLYSSTINYNRISVATISFGTTGTKYFRFNCTGKNSSSSQAWLGLDYIELVPN